MMIQKTEKGSSKKTYGRKFKGLLLRENIKMLRENVELLRGTVKMLRE